MNEAMPEKDDRRKEDNVFPITGYTFSPSS